MSLTLRKIKNADFSTIYKKFLLDENMSRSDYETILSLAIIFLNSDDLSVKKLGYRIIVMYSNRTGDYAPLYEIAINNGLYPIVKVIDSNHLSEEQKNFFTELNAAYIESYKPKSIYMSEQQFGLNRFYRAKKDDSISIVAPTSYGKTELILSTLRECKNKNICIITPTKSLLSQTRKRILDAKIDWITKVIVHPDMYNANDSNCVAVLTQERLLRLLKNNNELAFDYIIIDEAHNLLENDQRQELLASVIIILNKRNRGASFKFLTPFIKDVSNLKIRYASYDISSYTVDEYVKTEKLYLYDIRRNTGLKMYDQYMNEWYECTAEPKNQTSIQFIRNHAGDKNIIYFNKPVDIERFASEMLVDMPDIELCEELKIAIKHISEYIDPEYTIVKCLKKGVIYHHGSVPDPIRSYIEYLFTAFAEIKYVITSSTLLEGVNIPASKIFIMDSRKGRGNLTHASFKNLIGRVCRFSEIFDEQTGTLKKLEPEVYMVLDKYYQQNANVMKFLSSVMKEDKSFADNIENVLLHNTNITTDNQNALSQAREFIENYEAGTIDNYTERYAVTDVGKSCIMNNVTELDVFSNEKQIQALIDSLVQCGSINDSGELLEAICSVFLPFTKRIEENSNFLRFENEATKSYYKMFLSWKVEGLPFNQTIAYTVSHWRKVISDSKDTVVYVGKWGDLTRGGFKPLWTDIRYKDQTQLINLAIVRIKEEQDFIDNAIMKFVEVLNDNGVLDEDLYLRIKYGTSNRYEILLIQNGISLSLTKLLLEKYRRYVRFNIEDDTIELDIELIDEMSKNKENQILIFEAENNIIRK